MDLLKIKAAWFCVGASVACAIAAAVTYCGCALTPGQVPVDPNYPAPTPFEARDAGHE